MLAMEATAPELQGSIREIMTTNVHTARPETSIADVATLMVRHSLRRVVVIDKQKKVVGILSQRDILQSFLATEQESGSVTTTKVGSLILEDKPPAVTADLPMIKAAVVLVTSKIRCLPVVDRRGALIGVLSVTDLLRHLAGGATQSDSNAEFKFFTPAAQARHNLPAFIRRVTGELVVPLKGFGEALQEVDYTLLGYDKVSGRIMIRFVDDDVKTPDAIKVKRTKEQAVIPANAFVMHFGLNSKSSVFDISQHENGHGLLLTPKSKQSNDSEE